MKNKAPHDIDKIVGINIRLLRRQQKISQTQLGDSLGISFQQIQKYEKASNRISAGKLFEIAEYFGVGVATFYTGIKSDDNRQNPIVKLSREALDIAYAFEKINNSQVKKSVKGVVRTLASTKR